MSRRRNKCRPELKLGIWKVREERYFADRDELISAISASGRSDAEIAQRMGAGYGYIQELFEGKGIGIFSASHVEWGILPESAFPKAEVRPFPYSSP